MSSLLLVATLVTTNLALYCAIALTYIKMVLRNKTIDFCILKIKQNKKPFQCYGKAFKKIND